MLKYILLIVFILFNGCSFDQNNLTKEEIDKLTISKKSYEKISKDAIFEAAKKIFIFAGNNEEYRIDSYRNHLEVSKTKMSHFPFFAYTHEDFWKLEVIEEEGVSKASLQIFKIIDYEDKKPVFIDKSYHDLFWNRIEYLLGVSNNWISCNKLIIDFQDLLCDSVDMYDYIDANKNDKIKNLLISDREKSKSINEIEEDILSEDIQLTIDETKEDILEKEDNIDSNLDEVEDEKSLDEQFDKEIEALDKKVNDNIDETLDKIEKNIEDEIIEE